MGRRLSIRKFMPGFLFGGRIEAEDLADELVESIEAGGGTPADGSITPDKLDRSYVEATFGADAEGEPPGVLRKILRIWVQDGKLFGESDDEF